MFSTSFSLSALSTSITERTVSVRSESAACYEAAAPLVISAISATNTFLNEWQRRSDAGRSYVAMGWEATAPVRRTVFMMAVVISVALVTILRIAAPILKAAALEIYASLKVEHALLLSTSNRYALLTHRVTGFVTVLVTFVKSARMAVASLRSSAIATARAIA